MNSPKPKPALLTFASIDAVYRFIDAIFQMEDGRGITLHVGGKELEELAEKYLQSKEGKKS